MTITVKVETRELERAFKAIKKKLPSVTAATLNKTAVNARKNAIKNVAGAVNVPEILIRYRFDAKGLKKGERARMKRARPGALSAMLFVYMRGIPVGLIAGKQPKKKRDYVGARGGRKYYGAFYNPANLKQVFKRRDSRRLMMPKIGIREKLTKQYDHFLTGLVGKRFFKREWERAARLKLSKIQGQCC